MGNYICDCCGHKTLNNTRGSYQICPVCFWQDDGYVDEEVLLERLKERYKDYL